MPLIVPVPVPLFMTVIACMSTWNIAVTVVSAVNVTLHVVAVPEHPPPDQPPNCEPVAATAVNMIVEP
jgi:hypothetical protein